MKEATFPVILTLILSASARGQDESVVKRMPGVIPTPQGITLLESSFKVNAQTRIVLGNGSSAEDEFAAEQLNTELLSWGRNRLKIARENPRNKISSNIIFIGSPRSAFAQGWLKTASLKLGPELQEEGYILEVDGDGVVILAESARGRFYGTMTLLQLLERQKVSIVIPGLQIRDWPLQKVRGISDDLSRGQVSTMENFKKIIRFLARYKLNVYSPYIEDIFVFKSHPRIGEGRGELTAAQIRELDGYAKRYHVELIPTFETLGHWENILIMPEYARYGEFPGAHTLNVSDEAVYTMLDKMIGELSAAFSSPYFNMAADESWDVGLGVNKDRVAASSLAAVHADHYNRLFDILRKYKKKPMMYGDVILHHPEILEKIPNDVLIIDWHYGASDRYLSTDTFRAAGFPYVVSPAVWNFTGPFPNYLNTTVNIQNLSRDGYLNGSRGILTSNWNDYGGEALRELNYFGYAWTAECAWRPLQADRTTFTPKFFHGFFGDERAARAGEIIYTLLGNPLNQYNWHELWRHPMLPERNSNIPSLWRIESLESTAPLVEQLLDELGSLATRNRDHLPYLRFVNRLNAWFARKLSTSQEVKLRWGDTVRSAMRDSLRTSALESARTVLADLESLKEEFARLWLSTNRKANLQWLMLRYDRQAGHWSETINEIRQTGTLPDPVLQSQWIYHPDGNPGKRDTTARQVRRSWFRKIFHIEHPPSSAKLQLIGDTHAKVWVNGKEVGEVIARRSLSLIVEHQRVKAWEIGPLLKPGANVIAVEAANFDQFGSAGVNIYLEVRNGETIGTILSDAAWKVADSEAQRWKDVEYDDSSWTGAAVRQYPFVVVRPNLAAGRLSWIER